MGEKKETERVERKRDIEKEGARKSESETGRERVWERNK